LGKAELEVGSGTTLSSIMAHPKMAAIALRRSGKSPEEFFPQYHETLRTLRAAETGHQMFIHWPGGSRDTVWRKLTARWSGKPVAQDTNQLARALGAEDSLFAIEVPLRAPAKVTDAVLGIQGHFGGIVRPWLIPLLEGKKGATGRVVKGVEASLVKKRGIVQERLAQVDRRLVQLRRGIPAARGETRAALEAEHADLVTARKSLIKVKGVLRNTRARDLVDPITEFRDTGGVRIVGLSKNASASARVQNLLKVIGRGTARDVVLKDFYQRSSTPEGAFGLVAMTVAVGGTLDVVAHQLHSQALKIWTPWFIDSFDEGMNGWLSGREMQHNIARIEDPGERAVEKKRALKRLAASFGIGMALVASVAARLPVVDVSILETAQELAAAPGFRAAAGASMGAFTSGSGVASALLGSRRFVSPIEAHVKSGLIEAPTDRHGRPLSGRAFRRWAKRTARTEQLSFAAQQGALGGTGVSAVVGGLTAAFGLMSPVTASGEEIKGVRRAQRIGSFVATGASEGGTSAFWQNVRPRYEANKLRRRASRALRSGNQENRDDRIR
jgi:hypothetical protein